jgi:hypothetical protein
LNICPHFLLFSAQENVVELIGPALFTVATLFFSSIASLLSLAIQPLRRFSLAILVTPPAAVLLYFFCGWTLPSTSAVCGPDAVWGNCANTSAELLGWAIWFACSACAMVVGYLAQQFLQKVLRFCFESTPMSIFRNRPRWSRVATDLGDSRS